jgi:hypothetical protein
LASSSATNEKSFTTLTSEYSNEVDDWVEPQLDEALKNFNSNLKLRPLRQRQDHLVCVISGGYQAGTIPKPFPKTFRDSWDDKHVRMPFSSKNEFPVLDDSGHNTLKQR